jgi:hypothetical protein
MVLYVRPLEDNLYLSRQRENIPVGIGASKKVSGLGFVM